MNLIQCLVLETFASKKCSQTIGFGVLKIILGSLAHALSEVHVVGHVASDVAKITACNDADNRIAINVSINGDYLSVADGWQEDSSDDSRWTRVCHTLLIQSNYLN